MILIADHDPGSRASLVQSLAQLGRQAIEAPDGPTAYELIVQHAPSVAIIEWMMPGLDGVEFCRRIRQDPRQASMYVILLKKCDDQSDLEAGLSAGADDFLKAPLDMTTLRARLNVAVRVAKVSFESDQLLASLSSILIGLKGDGRITRWNSVAHQTFGLPTNHVIGRPLDDCGIAWTDAAGVRRLVEHGTNGETAHADLSFTVGGGIPRLVGVTITTMSLGGTRRPGRVILGTEITERRQLELQLRQAQKLEGIGQLAAGIAHEINTPMQYIGDNLRFLRDSMVGLNGLLSTVVELSSHHAMMTADGRATGLRELARQAEAADLEFLRDNLPEAVSQSLDGVERVSRIVRAMKEFAHPDGGEKEFVDLNHALETTLLVARNELKYVADVELSLDPELPRVPCLAGEVNQVFLNLLINAAHAIAEANRTHPGRRGRICVSTQLAGHEVEVRVSDTGTGIPEAIRTRVFEPFFTTKDVGQGTGQGLAIAHTTIVGRHNGRIWFETSQAVGTTFFLRLPLERDRRSTAA